ncbi:MAG: hypothetical protein Kow0088_08200 [Anaerolineales bacterium]
MASIAGISHAKNKNEVLEIIQKTAHRGKDHQKVLEHENTILASAWHEIEKTTPPLFASQTVWDGFIPPSLEPQALARWKKPFAIAALLPQGLFIARDPLGVKPLYYSENSNGLSFASEVKGLLTVSADIHEFPPGHYYTPQSGFQKFTELERTTWIQKSPDEITHELRERINTAIARRILTDTMGVWLSGGVDSSVIATLASKQVPKLISFCIGVKGSTDLEYGQAVAKHLNLDHHSYIATLEELLKVLPTVIYTLESFDALLVRSSITHYIISKIASDYVEAIFTGEGGDELFAGYSYMREIPLEKLPESLNEAVSSLHNTAFQRVDRCATSAGLLPLFPFADLDVVSYALSIPPQYKLYRQGNQLIEKWILRQTIAGQIPDHVLWRPKTKFWQGTGLKELLSEYAETKISDSEFQRQKVLPNGLHLISKEELMYYQIFKEFFGKAKSLDWFGRTKYR